MKASFLYIKQVWKYHPKG